MEIVFFYYRYTLHYPYLHQHKQLACLSLTGFLSYPRCCFSCDSGQHFETPGKVAETEEDSDDEDAVEDTVNRNLGQEFEEGV